MVVEYKCEVSVIVPVYNVELYIEACVRSLMEQTLADNIEYIFVNDYTPDESIQILHRVLQDYPARQDQVKIIEHTENKGSAVVRNTGLQNATGRYIIHCDSDDWVEKDIYEKLLRKAVQTDADVVVCDFYDEYTNHSIIRKQLFPEQNDVCVKKMLKGELHCGTWNKLIKRKLYEQANIRFPKGINMWEDVSTIIPLCFHANKIAYVPEALYHYVHYNMGSYTYSVSGTSLGNLIDSIDFLESFFQLQGCDSIFSEDLCYMKLTVKLNLLLGSNGNQQKKWNSLYSSANRYIFTYSSMSWYWRIALWMASNKLLLIFNFMSYLGKKVRG